jgi:Fe-S-cluster containining protein
VRLVPSMRSYDRGDGTCRNLDEATKTCRIYDTRPPICRTSDTRPQGMAEPEWFQANVTACRSLQKQAGIPEGERSVMP